MGLVTTDGRKPAVDLLTDDEQLVFARLRSKISRNRRHDSMLDAYYEGTQRLKHIGLAVPEQLRQFETVINVPRMAVDEVQRRMDVRFLISPGSEDDDVELRRLWDSNDMDSQLPLLLTDALIYGRGFATVSVTETGGVDIRVEHAPDMAVSYDVRTREVNAALRIYRDEYGRTPAATLFLPGVTVLLERDRGQWVVTGRYAHSMGVPVVPFVNRPRSGAKLREGVTEMADVIGLTDAIARTITNMQVASETHAVPQKYVTGMTDGDFVDAKTGKPKPLWEAYFSGVWTIKSPQAKPGNFTASSLQNFTDSVNNMLAWCAAVLGLPTRYAGQQSVNPASESAIKADESRLVKNCERKATVWGDSVGRLMGLAKSISTGAVVDGRLIKVVWNDPSTPTLAEKADALQKLAGGKALLSREGVWDELGWSAARKEKERQYFDRELNDPTIQALGDKVNSLG